MPTFIFVYQSINDLVWEIQVIPYNEFFQLLTLCYQYHVGNSEAIDW